jgi:predicted RNase H-like HicB family nuclease
MRYLAAIEKSEGWWIGWLIDLPGVNAQERTREDLVESLRICTEEMLDLRGIKDDRVEIVVPTATDSSSQLEGRVEPDVCPALPRQQSATPVIE